MTAYQKYKKNWRARIWSYSHCYGLAGWKAHTTHTFSAVGGKPLLCSRRAWSSLLLTLSHLCAEGCLARSHSPQNARVEESCLHILHMAHPSLLSRMDLLLAALTTLWALCCLSVSTAMAKPIYFFKQPRATTCSVPHCSHSRGQGCVPTSSLPPKPSKSTSPDRGLPCG